MNIRELDEESRRTGVWPPRRIILRVEEGEEEASSVKVGEVDLNAPREPVAKKPREVPPLPAPSLSPSVTPSRRRGLPGSRGVTPAPAASPEDAAFEQWVASPLPDTLSEPEYQETPAWLPDDVRVRADRRHRRVSRKARSQLFGASAATTLAVAGCAAAVAVFGLSQTESVGGSLGVPSIGLFGTAPEPAADETADAPKRERAERERSASTNRERRQASSGATRRAAAPPARTARDSGGSPGGSSSRSTTRRASSTPAASNAPARPARNTSPPPVQQRRVSNPPPPPPAPAPRPTPQPTQAAPVVWDAPSQSAAPSRPATTAPSRPVGSAPAPTTSSPAP